MSSPHIDINSQKRDQDLILYTHKFHHVLYIDINDFLGLAVGNTLGVIPHAPIPREVSDLIGGDGASVASDM